MVGALCVCTCVLLIDAPPPAAALFILSDGKRTPALRKEVRMLVRMMSHAQIRSLFRTGLVPDLRETLPDMENVAIRGHWAVSTPVATPSPTEKASGAFSRESRRLLGSPERFPLRCRE